MNVRRVGPGCVMLWVTGLLVSGCGAAGAYVAPTAADAACQVKALVGPAGEVDIIPARAEGVGLRVTHHSPDVVRQYLTKLWPDGAPAAIAAVTVERSRPKLAIILDDFGLHPGQLKHVWRIGQPFTYAILPQQQFSAGYARWLTERGASILAHLPMEPEQAEHMTLPGFLKLSMSGAERIALLRAHMASMPGAIGWNNHMGSRLTADRGIMRGLVTASEPDWVIVDSRTSAETTLESVARELGRPVARRHVFIDNDRDRAAIQVQLMEALELVKAEGAAVAIGHAYPETAEALSAFVKAHGDEVQLVPIERVTAPKAAPRWMRSCPRP